MLVMTVPQGLRLAGNTDGVMNSKESAHGVICLMT